MKKVIKTLPTTKEGNALVDKLLSKHTKGLKVRKPPVRKTKE